MKYTTTHKNRECPNCKSKRIQYHGTGFYALLGFLMISFSIWLLIIPPIGLIGIFIGFVILIASPFLPRNYICRDCKYTWKKEQRKPIFNFTNKTRSEIIFKSMGLLIGLGFIILSIFWRDDPDAASYLLFFVGILFIIGSTKSVVNEETK